MYFVHNIHRLPAGNREGWEGRGWGWGSTRAGNREGCEGREGREGCVDSWSISVENGFKLLILPAQYYLPPLAVGMMVVWVEVGAGVPTFSFYAPSPSRSHCLVLRLCIRIAFHTQYSKQYYADQQKPASVKSL